MVQSQGSDVRRHTRTVINGDVEVNGGVPPRGGKLYDMSIGGAAIVYPQEHPSTSARVGIDDEIILVIKGRAQIPGRVVRTFDGGFAVEFDWSIGVDIAEGEPLPPPPAA